MGPSAIHTAVFSYLFWDAGDCLGLVVRFIFSHFSFHMIFNPGSQINSENNNKYIHT